MSVTSTSKANQIGCATAKALIKGRPGKATGAPGTQPILGRILLIEDDPDQRTVLKDYLTFAGYQVLEAPDGEQGLKHGRDQLVDIVLCDWMLPDISGPEVCEHLRQLGFAGPIALLTCKGDLDSQVGGLLRGADDYLIKPVPAKLLKARLEVLLRRFRVKKLAAPQFQLKNAIFDRANSQLASNKTIIPLSPKETGILHLLVLADGAPVRREQILAAVWRYDYLPTSRSLDNYIMTLRRKLQRACQGAVKLRTRRGQGYILEGLTLGKTANPKNGS